MKPKTAIRTATAAGSVVLLAFSLFAVLHVEERKRLATREGELTDLLMRLRSSERLRESYYESLSDERARLRELMGSSEARYGELIAEQPGLVEAAGEEVTQVVEEIVPVQVPVVTRSTKTS